MKIQLVICHIFMGRNEYHSIANGDNSIDCVKGELIFSISF